MANNFNGDSNCKALWRMESGALTVDSKGTNTLTDNNTVGLDTVNFKEGACSADFERDFSEYLSITDANLNAGFPLKVGDTNKKISVCSWVKFESVTPGDRTIFSKWENVEGTARRSFLIDVDAGSPFLLILGFNDGTQSETKTHGSTPSLATWYHITASYYNLDKSYALRIRDISGNIVGTDLSDTFTLDAGGISIIAAGVEIGGFYLTGQHDGLIDEVVVFDNIITADEATMIAKGTYGQLAYQPWAQMGPILAQ